MSYQNILTQSRKHLAWIGLMCLSSLVLTPKALAVTSPISAGTPEGWWPHFESLITLAVVVAAFTTAWLLNHARPRMRTYGLLLAALCCFGIVAWFVVSLNTGIIDHPKKFQAPMDAWKPTLLWGQVIIAGICGLALLGIAQRESNSEEILDITNENETGRYGRVSRIVHWTTAILFIFMIPTGIFSSMIPEGVWFRSEYNVMHKTIGLIIFGLVVFRLIWNRKSKRPALDASLKPLEKKMAHSAHILLYVLMIAVPVTGYVMTSLHGYPAFFFLIEIPSFLEKGGAYVVWGMFHKYLLQYLVYIVLGAHVIGALKHHLIDKHKDAFKRMVL